jgi:hypothetical protein
MAVAGDAGGAAAILPVLQALLSGGRHEVLVLAYRQAAALFERRGVPFRTPGESFSRADADALLRDRRADLLFCGTSVNELELEKRLIDVANDQGVPSLAVLDYWSNYAARFSQDDGDLAHLPSRIAVMDESARNEMIAEGFAPGRLVITGQPAFDDLAAWRARFDDERRRAIRAAVAIEPDQILVAFFSQPLSQSLGTRKDGVAPSGFGYDETTILPRLIADLGRIAEQRRVGLVLTIRPHPREPAAWYETMASPSQFLRMLVTTEGESRELAMASNLVTGMTTVLLVEACYLGCLVVSLQSGLKGPDILPTNRLGLSRAVYRDDEIQATLEQMLFDDEVRQQFRSRLDSLRRDEGATQRVVALIDRMLGFSMD